MEKRRALTWILFLAMPIVVFAGYSPANVQAALKKMYPQATGVAWSQQNNYYVADFMLNELETDVWFDAKANWVMTLVDMQTTDALPDSVYNSFSMSDYADWQVTDVKQATFPECSTVFVIEVGQQNIDDPYQLFYLPNGSIIKTVGLGYSEGALYPQTFECE